MSESLKNPAWHGLQTLQSHLGVREGRAARFHADISPFAALGDDTGFDSLEALVSVGESIVLLTDPTNSSRVPSSFEHLTEIRVTQMVCEVPTIDGIESTGTDLDETHADQMLALARETDPGPFAIHTGRMGRYVGTFENGELIAMAGERFRLPGWTEISAVCTSERARGKGLAKRLMANLMRRIYGQGDRAFLHVRVGSPSEQAALHAYRQLGFHDSQTLAGQVFRRVK
ncbi:MAG: GNAT family N-acetyltransferase [Pseudomonadales bacterium]|nr:GNAT family N-acetyltransferase [Pseudomonadales bacterium]